MTERDKLATIALLLQCYRDLEERSLTNETYIKVRHILDAYAEAL